MKNDDIHNYDRCQKGRYHALCFKTISTTGIWHIKLSQTASIYFPVVFCWCAYVSLLKIGGNQRNHIPEIILWYTLEWRHNGLDSVSNHQPHDCLLNLLFRRRSKKTSKLRVIGLCEGNSPGTGEFPAHMPVTRKMFPFDDVIMYNTIVINYIIVVKQNDFALTSGSPRGPFTDMDELQSQHG